VATLDAASPELLAELIIEAWLRKAPKALTGEFLGSR